MKHSITAGTILIAIALPIIGHAEDGAAANAYVLGPQDQLAIRVNSLRRDTGEIYTWTPLSDTFAVGADGSIFLPLVGQVSASGSTPDQLAQSIAEALRRTANLAETPFATVEVTSYRPVFVIGAVQRPGRYEFQPGMTVLQALSTAEGFLRAPDLPGTQRQAISAGGDLRQLEAERISLQARIARYTAESAGDGAGIVFPTELTDPAQDDPRATEAMRHEMDRYRAGREALTAELAAIADAKALLQQELGSLAERSEALTRQQALYDEEVKVVSDLRERGLAVSSRQIAAESSQLSVRSSLLDVHVATLRAQQNLQQADRDIIELQTRYRTAALDSLATARDALERNGQASRTARSLLTLALSQSMDMVDTSDLGGFAPEYHLVRTGTAGRQEMVVGDSFAMRPGDVLQVQLTTVQAPGQ
ncbi:polysaccharide biosynthesis/export family protein [Frigidibacter sp. MR17.14]|uniref:polysaccharide biosynthesis/export family protein n=1 Tax=Frigidibacter sp. MR17.14 TaxID=3126509 RepID=UPI003012AC13